MAKKPFQTPHSSVAIDCSDVISFAPNVFSLSQGSMLHLIVMSPSLVADSFAVSPSLCDLDLFFFLIYLFYFWLC